MRKFILMSLLFTLLLSYPVLSISTPKHFNAKAVVEKTSFKKGDKFKIKLNLSMNKGWHSYAMQSTEKPDDVGPLSTEITVKPASSIAINGKIKSPRGKKEFSKEFEVNIYSYYGTVEIEIPVEAKKDIDIEKEKLFVVLNIQQCNATSCIPPDNFDVKITKQGAEETSADQSTSAQSSDVDQNASNAQQIEKSQTDAQSKTDTTTAKKATAASNEKDHSIWTTIVTAAVSGLLSILTPCVFPMVPITVSFFTKRTEQTKGKGLRDALAYAVGIITTFTGIGMIFSLVFGASGVQDLATSPWVNLFISLIFIIFALSLFGLFEIQMPTGLINKLNVKSQQGSGISSVLLMGLTFSLASFSCTGPIVGIALAAASQGQWFEPLISMIVFSTCLSMPFFLLALFPSAIQSLPRAGGWMNNIKVVMAFIVIASSFKFINGFLGVFTQPIPRDIVLGVWVSCFFFTALYILGIFKSQHDAPVNGVGTARSLFALLFMTVALYFAAGLFAGKNLGFFEGFLPAQEAQAATLTQTGVSSVNAQSDEWLGDYKTALEKAKATGKNIFIDFTGKGCTNCKVMERNIFPVPAVAEQMNKMIKVKLVTDTASEQSKSNKLLQSDKFNTVAQPFYVIISPDEQVIATFAFTSSSDEFVAFLKKGVK